MALDNFFGGLTQGYAGYMQPLSDSLNILGTLQKRAADAYAIDESQNTRANREAYNNALNYYKAGYNNDLSDRLAGNREMTAYQAANSVDPRTGQIRALPDTYADALRNKSLSNMYATIGAVDAVQKGAAAIAPRLAGINNLGGQHYLANSGYYGAEATGKNFTQNADGSITYTSPNGVKQTLSADESTQRLLNPMRPQVIDAFNRSQSAAEAADKRARSMLSFKSDNELAQVAAFASVGLDMHGRPLSKDGGAIGAVSSVAQGVGIPSPASLIQTPSANLAPSNNPPLNGSLATLPSLAPYSNEGRGYAMSPSEQAKFQEVNHLQNNIGQLSRRLEVAKQFGDYASVRLLEDNLAVYQDAFNKARAKPAQILPAQIYSDAPVVPAGMQLAPLPNHGQAR